MNQRKGKRKRSRESLPGLSREELFKHLSKVPGQREPVRFLQDNVWWWRWPEVKKDLWIQDQLDRWPECEAFTVLKDRLKPDQLSSINRENAGRYLGQILSALKPEGVEVLAHWWDQYILAAQEYELEARVKGAYPCEKSFIGLSASQRRELVHKHWKINLNSVPAVLSIEEPASGDAFAAEPGHWTNAFRFNLAHGDGFIVGEVRKRLAEERNRLKVQNPRHQGANRRRLDLSWTAIETIDIRCHARDIGPTHAGRQREYEAKKRRGRRELPKGS